MARSSSSIGKATLVSSTPAIPRATDPPPATEKRPAAKEPDAPAPSSPPPPSPRTPSARPAAGVVEGPPARAIGRRRKPSSSAIPALDLGSEPLIPTTLAPEPTAAPPQAPEAAPAPAASDAKTATAPPPSSAPSLRITAQTALEDDTARLLEDLDAGFDSIVEPPSPSVAPVAAAEKRQRGKSSFPPPIPREEAPPTPAPEEPDPPEVREARHQADMKEVRELFAGIAAAYARPIRDFMIEVAWSEATHEWLEVTLPATKALRTAAAAVELPDVDAALEGFAAALELAMGEATLGPDVREMLTHAYGKLVEALPSVFELEAERSRREPIIVRSLLLQVPGVRHVALEKLYRAGIHSLEVLYAANPRELADATGLEPLLAAAIYDRFQRYRREVAELAPSKDRAKERAELGALVAELERHHEAHEKAAASWAKDAGPKRIAAKKDREAALVRIELFLARLGEVDLQASLAKLPFHHKIRELHRFLDEANQRAGR